MGKNAICAVCGAALPADAPHGLCPKCLLKCGLDLAAPADSPDTPPAAPPEANLDDAMAAVTVVWRDIPDKAKSADVTIKTADKPRRGGPAVVGQILLREQNVARAKGPTEGAQYEIQQVLGEGGMGVVYEARQTSADRVIALKVLNPSLADDREHRSRFLNEAAATADLEHPNVVPVYDVAVDRQGLPFYAMKRVRGVPWNQVIREKTTEENLEILMRVADAVSYAHSRDVIHRDLKPGNVMLGDYGEVLLLDWGLAASVSEHGKAEPLESSSAIGGTPAYMAPELARGDLARVGTRSDIYLLGAILYEIVAGFPPHRDFDVRRSLARAAKNAIERTSAKGELVTIALKAMATEPADRYASVKEFQTAIRTCLSHGNSIALSSQAQKDLERAAKSGRYDDYAQAVFGYTQALKLWGANEAAGEGLGQARRAYAERALGNGDLDLAASLVSAERPAERGLAARIESARRERDRRRRVVRSLRILATTLGVLVGTVITVAYLWIRHEHSVALVQKDRAERAGRLAERARDSEARLREAAEYDAYVAEINAAANSLANNEVLEAQRLLAACSAKYRGWEWDYLARQLSLDEMTYRARQRLVTGLAALPDGRRFVTAGANGTLKVWQIGVAECEAETTAHGRWIDAMDVSPDGRYVASVGGDSRLVLHETEGLKPVRSIRLGSKPCRSLAFSPDGRIVGVGQEDMVTLYDTASGALMRSFGRQGERTVLAFSPNGRDLAVGGSNPSLLIYDLATFAPTRVDQGDVAWVRALRYSPDGRKLLIAPGYGGAMVLDLESRELQVLRGHRGPLTDIKMLPDQSAVVTSSEDTSWILWDAATGRPLRSSIGHTAQISSIALTPDGKRVITAGFDDSIKVWDIRGPERASSLSTGAGAAFAVAFSRDSSLLAGGGAGNRIKIWDAATGQEADSLDFPGWTLALDFSPDGKHLLAVGGEGGASRARLYSVGTFSRIRDYKVSDRDIDSAVFAPDNRHVLMGSRDAAIRLVSVDSGQVAAVFKGEQPWVLDLAFFPDGRHFLSGGPGSIRCWDALEKSEVWHAWEERGQPNAVAVSPSGELFYADGVLYRGVEREYLHALRGQCGSINAAAFSPDGERIATASVDGSIKIWDVRTGRSLLTLREHEGGIEDIAFSPNGLLLASAGQDGTIILRKALDYRSPQEAERDRAVLFTEEEAVVPQGSNLLHNAGFERAGTREERAYAWEQDVPGSRGGSWGSASRRSWRARSGQYEGTVCGGWSGTNAGGWHQEVRVEGGGRYRLTAWCYADSGSAGMWQSGWHGSIIEFFSGAGARRPLGAVSNHFGVLQETWSLRQITATAPAGAAVARVSIVARDNSRDGSLQFDDLCLEQLPEGEPR